MEQKRILPSWMVRPPAANKASKPVDDTDAKSVVASDEVSVVTKSKRLKAKGVTRIPKKEVGVSSDKSFIVKCETKRKKRGSVEKDVIECGDDDKKVEVEKRKRGRVKREAEETESLRTRSKKKYRFDGGNEDQDLACDEEDDDDLTMEDVLSIAKEFVKNDKSDTGQQKPPEVQREMRSKSVYARSPMREETDSPQKLVEPTSEVKIADFKTTEDAAQDMLDLFLGPLLNKPAVKEATSSTNDIFIPREIKNQQNAAVISNKPVPVTLTKKKSSLRDAVAMLLD